MSELKEQFDSLKQRHPETLPLLIKGWQLTEPTDVNNIFEKKLFRVCKNSENNSNHYIANNLHKTISTLINLEF